MKHSLTARQRVCAEIAVLYTLQRRRGAARRLARLKRQFPQARFFQEIFFHLSLVLGFPAMLDGLETISGLFPRGATSAPKRKHRGKGREIFQAVYGRQSTRVLRKIRALHEDAHAMILRDVYGRIFSRPGLTLAEREVLNIVVLAIQGFDAQLYSHVRGAMRAGLDEHALRELRRVVRRMSNRSLPLLSHTIRFVVSHMKKS